MEERKDNLTPGAAAPAVGPPSGPPAPHTSPHPPPSALSAALPLTPVEARVLGCLIEKEMTTPEYYPLTLNSLTTACNQKSNRDPVMQIDEKDVVRALDEMRYKKLAWQVTSSGNRVPKFKHALRDASPMPPQELAILAELMVRGPQTAAELRLHAARMTPFTSVDQAQTALQELTQRPDHPLVTRLPRVPGQREERYAHLLCGAPAMPQEKPSPIAPAQPEAPARDERLAALEKEVAALRAELENLKAQFADFAKQFQ